MTEQTSKVNDPTSSEKIRKKFKKGDLVKVDREKYLNSLESEASDDNLPGYIFEGPGEILLVKGDYFQIRWRRPVPDVWINSDHIILY
tara:strand:- start:155 stop:418 length:264 start_codon:yes stop_codon:yes gene_type:complete